MSGEHRPVTRHPPGAVHPVLEPSSLELVYDPGHLRACRRGGGSRASEYGPSIVSGPFDYWYLRHLRERHGLPSHDGRATEADVFLWSTDDAGRPEATRYGGVPYLPRRHAWPERHGVTGRFLAQLNFADSRELVPFAPRDVLLVFTFDHAEASSWERDDYAFVWVDADEVARWRAEDVPEGGLHQARQLHGVRARCFEDASLVKRIRSEGLPHVHVITATKIGGVPRDEQGIDPPDVPDTWRFLGQLVHQYPTNDVPFPVLGHPDPVRYLTDAFSALTGGVHGTICLFLDPDGEVQIFYSCS